MLGELKRFSTGFALQLRTLISPQPLSEEGLCDVIVGALVGSAKLRGLVK